MDPTFRELQERLAEIADLGRAAGVLGWDQRTMMPPRSGEARAEASPAYLGAKMESLRG